MPSPSVVDRRRAPPLRPGSVASDRAIRDAPADLVLLDLNMPRLDGREVLATVKADEELRAIPVVVFSTSASADDVAASYLAHANAYVSKPIDLDRFGYVIGKVHEFYGEVTLRPGPPEPRGRFALIRAGAATRP